MSLDLAPINLGSRDPSQVVSLTGGSFDDIAGWSVSGAGDLNGDGLDDLVVAAPGANRSYVVFGASSGWTAFLDFGALDGKDGFRLHGASQTNDTVSAAGDINGDGLADLLIGGYGAADSYLVYGTRAGFAPSLDLAKLKPSQGVVIHALPDAPFGPNALSAAGDLNGDGVDDFVAGATNAAGQALTCIVFGSRTGLAPTLDLAALDGKTGFTLHGLPGLGNSVASGGDVNGDGLADIIVASADRTDVVFGTRHGFASTIDLATLPSSQHLQIDIGGGPVAGAGDVNGDGIDDLIIGGEGKAYLVFGTRDASPGSIGLSDLDGARGFTLIGSEEDSFGASVAIARDVNGDGIDDIVVGAPSALQDGQGESGLDQYAGQTFVIYGRAAGFSARVDIADLAEDQGLRIDGFIDGRSGTAVAGAGDVNGDGLGDLVIGAPSDADPGSGGADIVFGILSPTGSAGADRMEGTGRTDHLFGKAGADLLRGLSGDDLLEGGNGKDTLRGGHGDDVLVGGRGNDLISGGRGTDQLIGGSGADRFRFASIRESSPDEFHADRLTGDKAHAAAFDGAGAAGGDVIDFRQIDADADKAGHQDLIFGGRGRGHVWLTEDFNTTLVHLDTTGDRHADFLLLIEDGDAIEAAAYSADDFLL